jgi:hypothetical protein
MPDRNLCVAREDEIKQLSKILNFSGQALVELGPDLIGIFIPGAGLAAQAVGFLAEKQVG